MARAALAMVVSRAAPCTGSPYASSSARFWAESLAMRSAAYCEAYLILEYPGDAAVVEAGQEAEAEEAEEADGEAVHGHKLSGGEAVLQGRVTVRRKASMVGMRPAARAAGRPGGGAAGSSRSACGTGVWRDESMAIKRRCPNTTRQNAACT